MEIPKIIIWVVLRGAQKYAEKSISASDNYNHLWYASALGRTGQVKGVLSSLSKARPMRTNCEKVQNEFLADDSDTWYVLGDLYNQLSSAGNLRFGDKNFAISYMRRCIDTQDNENRAYLANYLELAKQLYERDWSASKRSKKAGR